MDGTLRMRGVWGKVRKLAALVRERRVDQLVRYFFEVVPRGMFHADVLYVTELIEPNRHVRRPRQISVRGVEPGDIPRLHEVFPRGGADEFADRLNKGHRGFVCEAEGEIVAMSWLSLESTHAEPEKFCHFGVPADAAWAYDLWILPEWRLRGAMVAMVYHTIEFARGQGRRRLCGYASWHNRESLTAHVSFGHRAVGKLLVVNLFGLRLFRSRRLEPSSRPTTQFGYRSTPTVDLLSSPRRAKGSEA